MSRRSVCLLLLTPCLALAQPGPKPGPDAVAAKVVPDDPPPRGAVLRIGNQRLSQGGNVRGVALRRDGKVLYSCGDDSPLRAWDVATGRELPAPAGVTGNCSALAASRDGRMLAAAGQDCVRVIDLESGKVHLEIALGGNPCTGLAFAPDGKSLAWTDGLRQVHLHDFATNKELRLLKGAALRMNPNYDILSNMGVSAQINPAFAPNGKSLAAPTSDGAIFLWDVATGKRLRAYMPAFDDQRGMTHFTGAFFADGGKALHTVAFDGKVRVWERDSMEEKSLAEVAQELIASVALTPDGKTAAGGTPQGNIHLWNVENGKAVAAFKADEAVSAVAFSADGKTLATGGNNGALRLWEVATGKEMLMPGVRRAFLAVAFTDGGAKLVTVSKNSIGHWSARDGRPAKEVPVTDGKPALVKLSPTGKHAFLQLEDQQTRLVDCETGQLKEGPRESWQHSFNLSAFSPGGDLLAVSDGQDPRVLKLFDTATGKERRVIKYEAASVGSVVAAFSPDGRALLTGHGTRGLMDCHELATGGRRRPARLPPNVLPDPSSGAMMYFPNGLRLGSGETVHLPGATFAPDSRHLAIPVGLRIGLAELATGKLVRWFDGADKPVVTMAFSPDGRWLVASGQDRVLRLWDARTGQLKASVEGHRGNVPGLAFAPDGKRFASASDDGTVAVWDVDEVQRRVVARASAPATRPFDELWRDLGSDDAAVAEKAMTEMVSNPIVAIPEMKSRLKPVPPVEPATLTKLIDELDSNVVQARDDATRQLEEMDTLAAKALKAAAEKATSPEVKKRVARLLDRLDKTQLHGVEAQTLRAVEALEQTGAEGARKLLEELARGAADARLTRDAEAAAARLRLRGES